MMRKHLVLFLLTVLLCLGAMGACAEEHVLDATTDLPAMAQGAKQDGESETFKDYFTVLYSAKNKIDGSEKTFDDGYTATQRLNFGGKTQPGKGMINSVRFKVDGAAMVKFWWVSGGDGRQFALYDESTAEIARTEEASVKNSLYISTLEIGEAGTYYLGVPDGSNYLFKLQVTEHPAAATAEYVLDATTDLPAMAQGAKQDGESETFKDYFTVLYSAKNKIDGSEKTFDDGYTATQRLNFGGKTQPGKGMINSVRFKVDGAATVKFWWVSGGDGRQFALYDESTAEIARTEEASVKNGLYISTLEIGEAGTYYLGVPDGSNYLFKLQVTVSGGAASMARAAWEKVAAPEILSAADTGDGEMTVSLHALVGYDGADEVYVYMYDAAGKELDVRRSIAETDAHTLTFEPTASGEYTFRAVQTRQDEADKESAPVKAAFTLPLGTPHVTSATSAGAGAVTVVWTEVNEATGYEVFCNGTSAGVSETLQYTVTGLAVGSACDFSVRALRNNEAGDVSAAVTATVTEEAQRAWSFTVYGPSTNEKDNGYLGSVNDEGFVTVYSENGKGKIQPNADDGLAFYYTAIPADRNFTLRARMHVDGWRYSNGQEGFGLMVADSVPPSGTESFFTNQYMALASKIEYYFLNGRPSESGAKYTMRLGLGMLSKLMRMPQQNNAALPGYVWPLETSAVGREMEGVNSYNIIGNNLNRDVLDKTAYTYKELTDFILEIQKNNTGYFVTYYDEDGKVLGQYKDYDPNALNWLDTEYDYVGFFAARNARVTFTDIVLEEIDPASDAAIEEKPVTVIVPVLNIVSAETSNKDAYTVSFTTNVYGTADVYIDGERVAENVKAEPLIRNDCTITLPATGEMLLEVVLKPDEKADLGEDTVLKDARAVAAELVVSYVKVYGKLSEIYVSPVGTPSGRGTKENPLSLSAAVQYVQAGQTIVLLEGEYHFVEPLRIPHGIDGTADALIRMIADPQAATRPVLDFRSMSAGIIHGGDYWYFEGFDVTGAMNGQKGFQVSGHYNTLNNIHTYRNGNSGIQISRYAGSDPVSEWPSHNLILNCTSYENADAGYEDADGFAAKLTCGEGNVFDGCVAYHNADDGFDLYAKIETGPIGKVTIRNCVAYLNGVLPDGTIGGNGNGFKMGGSNIPGGHSLINSYAFFNRSKGIDANSCPDLTVENCVSYNNQRYNVAFYTNVPQDTAYQAKNVISFKDDTIPGGDKSEEDELKPRGAQVEAAFKNDTCYYWNGAISVNAAGDVVTAEDFVSLEFVGVDRNEDGSINLHGFLQMAK